MSINQAPEAKKISAMLAGHSWETAPGRPLSIAPEEHKKLCLDITPSEVIGSPIGHYLLELQIYRSRSRYLSSRCERYPHCLDFHHHPNGPVSARPETASFSVDLPTTNA